MYLLSSKLHFYHESSSIEALSKSVKKQPFNFVLCFDQKNHSDLLSTIYQIHLFASLRGLLHTENSI